ncbi:unnamed protein product [Prunus armeniaca]
MLTLGLGLHEPPDCTIVINQTIRSRSNSRDMCPRIEFKLVHALLGAGGTRAWTNPQEGPSRGPASLDQE